MYTACNRSVINKKVRKKARQRKKQDQQRESLMESREREREREREKKRQKLTYDRYKIPLKNLSFSGCVRCVTMWSSASLACRSVSVRVCVYVCVYACICVCVSLLFILCAYMYRVLRIEWDRVPLMYRFYLFIYFFYIFLDDYVPFLFTI